MDLGVQQKQPGAQLHVPRPGEARQGDRSEKPEGGQGIPPESGGHAARLILFPD